MERETKMEYFGQWIGFNEELTPEGMENAKKLLAKAMMQTILANPACFIYKDNRETTANPLSLPMSGDHDHAPNFTLGVKIMLPVLRPVFEKFIPPKSGDKLYDSNDLASYTVSKVSDDGKHMFLRQDDPGTKMIYCGTDTYSLFHSYEAAKQAHEWEKSSDALKDGVDPVPLNATFDPLDQSRENPYMPEDYKRRLEAEHPGFADTLPDGVTEAHVVIGNGKTKFGQEDRF